MSGLIKYRLIPGDCIEIPEGYELDRTASENVYYVAPGQERRNLIRKQLILNNITGEPPKRVFIFPRDRESAPSLEPPPTVVDLREGMGAGPFYRKFQVFFQGEDVTNRFVYANSDSGRCDLYGEAPAGASIIKHRNSKTFATGNVVIRWRNEDDD